jgi:glycosyltransferase involved in cell wall biosynthesis
MIKNQSFICLPQAVWESDHVNTLVQMMSILSRENKILFVDYEYTIKDILTTLAGKQKAPVQRILGIENRLRKIKTRFGSEVYVLTPPPVLPVNWIKYNNPYRILLQLNARLIRGSICAAMKALNMERPIMVNGYNPFFGLPLAGAFKEVLNIYYCYDEIRGDQWYKFHGPEVEKDYIKKTDAVITTSEALYHSKRPLHPKCFVVKNGVDFPLFNSMADHTIKLDGSRKTVGYTGSVDERFDTDTMVYVVENTPEVDYVFAGRVTNADAKRRLEKFSNIRFLGSKKPEEIPHIISSIDAGIIPYIKNEVTGGVYPLKINEYLAAGKPVVMTDFARLSEFEEVAYTAHSSEEFLMFLKQALYSNSMEKINRRIEVAKGNSWENRVEEFSSIVEKLRINKLVV